MKLIIDIDDELAEKEHWYTDKEIWTVIKAVQNGTPIPDDIGDFSDGYHTFNQLYHQRAVLFATIVNLNKDISWKSWKHEDGKYCFDRNGEWFIVGIDTPQGSYTYHYEKEYWDMFKCQELSNGKHWDGHTEDDVIRLLSLVPLVSISENTTNGDVITAMFPKAYVDDYDYGKDPVIDVYGIDDTEYVTLRKAWWNAPYQKSDTTRKNCEYRHENGNCLKVGGFCTSVDDEHCVKGGK